MNMFSLRTLIDDILLLVRNNNISESEDLSRAQIAAWVMHYRALFIKQQLDKDKAAGEDETSLSSLKSTKGPLELVDEESLDDTQLLRKKTELKGLLDNDEKNIFAVFDQQGYPIQVMDEHKTFFNRFRKYTSSDLTCWYECNDEGSFIYVHGIKDCDNFKYIWVSGLFDNADDDVDEDEIKIPDWMVPDIKKNIIANELSFMLQRISDDDNNSTLDGIKPQPQLNEK